MSIGTGRRLTEEFGVKPGWPWHVEAGDEVVQEYGAPDGIGSPPMRVPVASDLRGTSVPSRSLPEHDAFRRGKLSPFGVLPIWCVSRQNQDLVVALANGLDLELVPGAAANGIAPEEPERVRTGAARAVHGWRE